MRHDDHNHLIKRWQAVKHKNLLLKIAQFIVNHICIVWEAVGVERYDNSKINILSATAIFGSVFYDIDTIWSKHSMDDFECSANNLSASFCFEGVFVLESRFRFGLFGRWNFFTSNIFFCLLEVRMKLLLISWWSKYEIEFYVLVWILVWWNWYKITYIITLIIFKML